VIIVPGHPGPSSTSTPTDRRPCVLIVDRQSLFVDALASLLGRPPLLATPLRASGSDLALEILRERRIDLVLCELRLEPVSLLEFLKHLRALDRPPPTIVLGVSGEEADLLDLFAEGASGIFTKETEPGEFLAGVRAVLAGHRVIGSHLIRCLLRPRASLRDGQRAIGLHLLSPTERDILAMVGAALSINRIAEVRGISPKTVRNHLASIYRKLELRSRTEAMLCAVRLGLTRDEGGLSPSPHRDGRPARWE
jgi:DNA-binding NarL/FixJ family response regulator